MGLMIFFIVVYNLKKKHDFSMDFGFSNYKNKQDKHSDESQPPALG